MVFLRVKHTMGMHGYRLARQFRVFCENYAKAVSTLQLVNVTHTKYAPQYGEDFSVYSL